MSVTQQLPNTATGAAPISICKLKGRLDADYCNKHGSQLPAEYRDTEGHLLIDLSDVDFVDSTGLGLLVMFNKLVSAQGRVLALCNPSKQVQMLFELTRMHQVLNVYPSEQMALVALDSQA